MAINFMSSKDTNEMGIRHTKTDNIEIMIGNEKEDIQKHFDSLLQKYQKDLQDSMKDSEFVFDSITLLHKKYHKISLNHAESYKDSAKWLKDKKSTSKLKINDNKCFQYDVTVALNYEQI